MSIMSSDITKTNNLQWTLKWISLITLVFQNAVLGLSMRYARTQPGDLFFPSTAVVMAELVKLLTCLILTFFQEGSFVKWFHTLHSQIIQQPVDTLKVSVPSLVYILQNNLLYVAASNLDAAVYQVLYQLKILTTAIFSVLMLKKHLGCFQWIALVFLLAGFALVQVSGNSVTSSSATGGHEQNRMLGLIAVVISCCMSGFAGVYFEKILKGSDVSVWVRNIQLSFLGIPFGILTMIANDGSKIKELGFFHAYNGVVWFVVFMQALGGLLVAAVVKYADNILKGFATALAIIVASIMSIYLFDFVITWTFSFGTLLVIISIFLYSHQTPPKSQSSRITTTKICIVARAFILNFRFRFGHFLFTQVSPNPRRPMFFHMKFRGKNLVLHSEKYGQCYQVSTRGSSYFRLKSGCFKKIRLTVKNFYAFHLFLHVPVKAKLNIH